MGCLLCLVERVVIVQDNIPLCPGQSKRNRATDSLTGTGNQGRFGPDLGRAMGRAGLSLHVERMGLQFGALAAQCNLRNHEHV